MRFLVVAQGTHGDINPHAALALELIRRGHEAIFIASEFYEPLISRLGIELAATMPKAEYLRIVSHPDAGRPSKAIRFTMQNVVLPEIEPIYNAIEQRYQPGTTAILAPAWAAGARLANEKLGAPLATIALSPTPIRSAHQPLLLPDHVFRRIPLSLRKGLLWSNAWLGDLTLQDEINRVRQRLGLPPVRPVRDDWAFSPQLILCLFPEWFSPCQPDWPAQVRLTGFTLFDEAPGQGLRPEVEEFLAAGSPPVVVNATSGKRDSKSFFETSVAALKAIGRRGILLTPFAGSVPNDLPPGIACFGYVSHSALLGRAAAIIHQGGIGTISKSIAAGIPQLVVPFMNDQYYNSQRVTHLGLGANVYSIQFKTERVARVLNTLLGSEEVARNCAAYAGRLQGRDGAALACDVIEETFCFKTAQPGRV